MTRRLAGTAFLLAAAATLAGCASTYQLTLMPRDSGKLYYGQAVEQSAGGPATVTVQIEDRIYTGNWVTTSNARSSGWVSGGIGWGSYGRHAAVGAGTGPVYVDNPYGAEAKALLQAPDGSGLRCDFRGLGNSTSAGGTCQDDKGLLYDVQLRLVK